MTDGRDESLVDTDPISGYAPIVRSGGRHTVASAVLQQLVSVVSTFVLVRLLDPDEFGIVAAAMVILGLLTVLGNLGVGLTMVKRDVVDDVVTSTLFWGALGTGVVATAAMAGLSPLLAQASGLRQAAPYIALLSPVLVFSLAGSVLRGLLTRRLRYAAIARIDVTAAVVYAVLQVAFAMGGLGAASMLTAHVISSATAFGLYVLALRWKPSRRFDRRVFIGEAGFHLGVFANVSLAWLAKNADYWVVAHVFGAEQLGLYYVAYVIPNVLRQRITWSVGAVLLPVMARIRDDTARARSAYLRSLRLVTLVGLPAMSGLALVATLVVDLVFGGSWADSAGVLRVLALTALVELSTQVAATMFIADGRPGTSAVIEASRLAALVIGLAIAARRESLIGVALAVLAAAFVAAVFAQVRIGRRLELSPRDLASCIAPALMSTGVMVAVVLAVDTSTSLPQGVALVVLPAVGAATFLGAGLLVFRESFRDLVGEVRAFLSGRT